MMYKPKTFRDFINQRPVLTKIEILTNNALDRSSHIPHMLFYGGEGLGKKTIAKMIASHIGSEFKSSLPNEFNVMGVSIVTGIGANDILFIDGVERLKPSEAEYLGDCLMNFKMNRTTGIHGMRLPFHRFTFIGATEIPSQVSKHLKDACKLEFHFKLYEEEAIARILRKVVDSGEIQIVEQALALISAASDGVPEEGLRLLEKVERLATVKGIQPITEDVVIGAIGSKATMKNSRSLGSKMYEHDLESILVGGPEDIEPGLQFIERQRNTPVGRIDMLCRDRSGNLVVIELKRHGVNVDSAVGQIARYMGWARENLVSSNEKIRGIIIVGAIDDKLKYAAKSVPNLEVKRFKVVIE